VWCCAFPCSTAVVGPGFLFLEHGGASALVLMTWRIECVFLFLLPFSMYEAYLAPRRLRRQWFERTTVVTTVVASLGWGGTLACYALALSFTSTLRASLMSSLTPLVLLAYYAFTGQRISRGELWGAVLATLGMAICFLSDSDPERSADFGMAVTESPEADPGGTAATPTASALVAGHTLFGDMLATAASVFTAVDVEYSLIARQTLPLFTFSAAAAVVAGMLVALCAVVFEGATLGVSLHGLLGWLLPEYFYPVLVFSFVVGFLAILGFNHAIKYVPPLVFSVIILMEPVLTGIFSFEIGLEALPSLWTGLGGGVILAGILLVVVNASVPHAH